MSDGGGVMIGTKLETFEKVYRSLVKSIGSLNTRIVVFSDGCGSDFHQLITRSTPEKYDFEIIQIGRRWVKCIIPSIKKFNAFLDRENACRGMKNK